MASPAAAATAPRVAVGMPVYNSEKHLAESIASVLAQSFTDFELIISDNASIDGSWAICAAYAARDSRIRLLRNPVNLGGNPNYRKVADAARAEYFKWASSNDLLARDYLERCVAILDARPDAVLAYGASVLFTEDPLRGTPYDDRLDLQDADPARRFREAMQRMRLNNVASGLMRLSALRRSSGLPDYLGSDNVLIAELALAGKIIEVPDTHFYRRMSPASATRLQSQEEVRLHHYPTQRLTGFFQTWQFAAGCVRALASPGVPLGARLRAAGYVTRQLYWFAPDLVEDVREAFDFYVLRGRRAGTAAKTGLIALVPDRWTGIWTTRHQVIHRLARTFDVVWVGGALPWNVFWTPRGRRSLELRREQDVAPAPGCTIFDPGRWSPEIYRPTWLRDWIRRRRIARARSILKRRGCTRIVLSIWRPQFAWALDACRADLSSYHIDDEYSFAPVEQPNEQAEVALIRRADVVFVHSRSLLEKKGGLNPDTSFVPNGVDYRAYSSMTGEPADLLAIPRPRMGYVGVLKKQLDLALMCELAQRHPEWSFVAVGPVGALGDSAASFERLSQQANVHLLGNRPLAALPAYTQHLDVCMMPYVRDGYTKFINPIKMYEYLAAGRPVVSAAIDSVMPFSDVVRIATTVNEWELALGAALSSERGADAARRARVADYDWDLIARQIGDRWRMRLDEPPAGKTASGVAR